jgi:hypothetical protein
MHAHTSHKTGLQQGDSSESTWPHRQRRVRWRVPFAQLAALTAFEPRSRRARTAKSASAGRGRRLTARCSRLTSFAARSFGGTPSGRTTRRSPFTVSWFSLLAGLWLARAVGGVLASQGSAELWSASAPGSRAARRSNHAPGGITKGEGVALASAAPEGLVL